MAFTSWLTAGLQLNPESREILPQLAFNSFASRYREPSLDEGFQDIVRVDFRFDGTELERELWTRYWY
jgi:bifunctional polynucleotide phosphatase/kinase